MIHQVVIKSGAKEGESSDEPCVFGCDYPVIAKWSVLAIYITIFNPCVL
jgi:hypothetical protein